MSTATPRTFRFSPRPNRKILCALVASVLLLLGAATHAATRYVRLGGADTGDCTPSSEACATIAYAKSQSFAGDTILVGRSAFDFGPLTQSATIDFPLTIEGRAITTFPQVSWIACSGDDCPTVVPPADQPALLIDLPSPGLVEVAHLNFRDGVSQPPIRVGAGRAHVADSRFFDSNRGALVAGDLTEVTIERCHFEGNSSLSGGAVATTATLDVFDSTFLLNSARSGAGGAIASRNLGGTDDSDPALNVVRSTFDRNVADDGAFNSRGGGIASSAGTVSISQSTFMGNVATKAGGGVSFVNSDVSIEQTVFTSNAVDSMFDEAFGGGISQEGGSLMLSGSVVSGNSTARTDGAGESGAGISIRQSAANQPTLATIADSTIENNDSIGLASGDGISIRDANVEVIIERSSIVNNSIFLGSTRDRNPGEDARLTLLASSVIDGAVALLIAQAGTQLSATNSTLSATVPVNGLSINENVSVELLHSTLSIQNGSAISAAGSSGPTTIINSIISGGCQRNAAIFTISRSIFDNENCASSALDVVDDIRLLPIGNYGGPTSTHYLRADSPAIDITLIDCLDPPVNQLDQRGEARPFGDSCDAGAIEFTGDMTPAEEIFSDGFESP